MEIIDVLDNRTNGFFESENGLALLIKVDGKSILFDTGRSGKVLYNLEKLDIDVSRIDHIVLSHNHNDHTGGLKSIIEKNDRAKIYLSADFFSKYYKVRDGRAELLSDDSIIDLDNRLERVVDECEIEKNVFLCRVKNVDERYVCQDKNLFEKKGDEYICDDFRHEIYIVVIDNSDAYIISSCTHVGIINVLNDVKRRFIDKNIRVILGGLHIKNYGNDEDIEALRDEIVSLKSVNTIYTCHCTGERAENILSKNDIFSVIPMYSGKKIDICKNL